LKVDWVDFIKNQSKQYGIPFISRNRCNGPNTYRVWIILLSCDFVRESGRGGGYLGVAGWRPRYIQTARLVIMKQNKKLKNKNNIKN
jgi:hypothetical protein